jgi:hypothetical protein
MNEYNFGEYMNTPNILERANQGTDTPLLDGKLAQPTLTGGDIVYVDPLDESIVDVNLIDETHLPEASMDSMETNIKSLAALLDRDMSEHFRTRWDEIQGRFVDEPRTAVQQADALVSEVVEKITQMFSNEHGSLESQWKQGNDVSTEDLRKSLQHYRSFFNRLVA